MGIYARVFTRIHVMAGRVPVGSQRTAVAREMEDTFIQNLRYAADVLSKVADVAIGVDACGPSVHWWECRGTFRRNLQEEPCT